MYSPWTTDPGWEAADLHLAAFAQASFRRSSLPLGDTPGIRTLLGPRRVGKSTQFKLWIKALLDRGVPPTDVAFLDAERFDSWKELLPHLERSTARYLFLDEITAVREWPRALKVLADAGRLANRCVWVTGSNAFDLKTLGERLPGRRGRSLGARDIELLPLCFREFHAAVRAKTGADPRRSFEAFCQWGGYPMAVSEYLERDSPSYDLLQELLDVVLGEASRRHKSPRLTAALAERLYSVLGSRVSYNSLAKFVDAGSHPIARQYVEILESCYALITVERLNHRTGTGVLRKDRKAYFFDPLVAGVLVAWAQTGAVDPTWFSRQWQDPTRQGAWLENVAATELRKAGLHVFYDEQYGGEIDFVVRRPGRTTWRAIEVKRQRPAAAELRPLEAYAEREVWVWVGEDEEVSGTGVWTMPGRLLREP